MSNEPEDLTQLEMAAAQLHEAYLSFLNTGFSEEHAISLTTAMLYKLMDRGDDD